MTASLRALEPLDRDEEELVQSVRPRSRRRPWRDGLATQTVAENFEDAKCYRALERAIVDSFAPGSAIERELIHRLASLLWRLRRATAIETGLFQMQSEHTAVRSYLGLAKFDPEKLERLSGHEARLWRQAAQTIWLLDAMRRPEPAVSRRRRKLPAFSFWDRDAH